MYRLRLLPEETHIPFMRFKRSAFLLSLGGCLVSILLFLTLGLNYGIDFKGGTLIEFQTKNTALTLVDMRQKLSEINLGDIQLQTFGAPDTILLRVEPQNGNGTSDQKGEASSQQLLEKIRPVLGDGVVYRRVETVGPRVSHELAQAGILAIFSAFVAVLLYIWIRFEWHFSLGALIATLHDVVLTVGLFSALRLDFTLSTIAALLMIVGYSLNDTVVIYDRIRENLRLYRKKTLEDLIDLSLNQTLSRTLMTSLTTLIALGSLYVFGGDVIRSFVFAMIWGVLVGTYSSLFIAAPLLLSLGLGTHSGVRCQVSGVR